MVEDEKFFAWLDGELDEAESERVAEAVAADPELERRAQQHRALGSRLGAAFGTIAEAPVPDRIAAAVRAPAEPSNVVTMRSWKEKVARPFAGSTPQWAAMAATLALGIVTGTMIGGGESGSPISVRGGQMLAAGAVEDALETQLASAGPADGVRIGLTFRDSAGRLCRSFGTEQAAGLACRDSGGWQMRGLFPASEGSAGEYRMVAGADPRLMEMIEESMAGEPFGPDEEREALRAIAS